VAVKCGKAVCLKKREDLLKSFEINILIQIFEPAREIGRGGRERVGCGIEI